MQKLKNLLVLLAAWALLGAAACGEEAEEEVAADYEGPLIEADSVRTLYSDSAIVRIMVEAPKQFEYENGDREFPEGLYLEFYESDGSVSSTLQADYGFLFSEEDRYTGIGNVQVVGVEGNRKLFTDTLHWSQPEEKVYTRSHVTIIEGMDTLKGQGLEAAQDFSSYTILKPIGSTVLEDEEEESAGEEEEGGEDGQN
ncbi:LPS export ABC transporter periplasmic protein LptC [Nafulsella turpanensis]|uniref:LPS export ABC transporter periplasmic protein LptC n=1 Tax=Nafulsella turpanensis TaxID=1265690 RepID=UPI00034BE896|nr:LPS export ABC transporter periplasmic protein LptC [Nafulsella turpanensis]